MIIDQAGIKFLYQFIYLKKPDFSTLSQEQIKAIQHNCKPVFPGVEWPELYPDEEGYTGLYFDLYRGYFFTTEEERDEFLESIKDGTYTSNTLESWTGIIQVAEEFAEGAGYYSYRPNEVKKEGYGVILKIENFTELEKSLYCSFEAHKIFRGEFEDFNMDEWEGTEELTHYKKKDTFFDEAEIALLPGTFQVSVERLVPEKEHRTLRLDKQNKVDTVLTPTTLGLLTVNLKAKSFYVTAEGKKFVHTTDRFDKIRVVLADGTEEIMNYTEYVHFRHEDKELLVFESDKKTLNIFHSANSEEVFGEIRQK